MSYQNMCQWLAEKPTGVFWADFEGGKPDYKGLFLEIFAEIANGKPVTELRPRDIFNPSSFQRAVALEARSRRKQRGLL